MGQSRNALCPTKQARVRRSVGLSGCALLLGGGGRAPSLQLSGPVPHSRVLRLEISAGNLCSQLLTIEVFLGFPQWWSVGGREPVLGEASE